MNFENSLKEEKTESVHINKIRASSLFNSSTQAIETAKIIPLNITTSKTILRELYEGLRECCEAIGYLKGYNDFNKLRVYEVSDNYFWPKIYSTRNTVFANTSEYSNVTRFLNK